MHAIKPKHGEYFIFATPIDNPFDKSILIIAETAKKAQELMKRRQLRSVSATMYHAGYGHLHLTKALDISTRNHKPRVIANETWHIAKHLDNQGEVVHYEA